MSLPPSQIRRVCVTDVGEKSSDCFAEREEGEFHEFEVLFAERNAYYGDHHGDA